MKIEPKLTQTSIVLELTMDEAYWLKGVVHNTAHLKPGYVSQDGEMNRRIQVYQGEIDLAKKLGDELIKQKVYTPSGPQRYG